MSFQTMLTNVSDDQLLMAMIGSPIELVPHIHAEWNRRHPEDPVGKRACDCGSTHGDTHEPQCASLKERW